MFDDPKKYLNDLDSRLRAERYEEELEKLVESRDDFDLDAILGPEEEPPLEALFRDPPEDDIPIRNLANGYGTRPYPGQIPQSPYQAPQSPYQPPQAPYQQPRSPYQPPQDWEGQHVDPPPRPRPQQPVQSIQPKPVRPKAQRPSKADAAVRRREEPRELDEDAALLDERPPKKGVGGLWIVLLLEIAGILAIVLWWVRWFL